MKIYPKPYSIYLIGTISLKQCLKQGSAQEKNPETLKSKSRKRRDKVSSGEQIVLVRVEYFK